MLKKLNLGAGNDLQNPEEYINHDLTKHRPEIDIAFDLNDENWVASMLEQQFDAPRVGSDMFDEIRAFDVLEHLDNPINFMDNCWDLLKKDGILHVKVCGWQNPNFHVDPTHKHAYDIKSFDYFDDSTEIGEEYGFYTKNRWKILEKKFDRRKNPVLKLTPVK